MFDHTTSADNHSLTSDYPHLHISINLHTPHWCRMKQAVKEFWRKAASHGWIFHGDNVMWHRPVRSTAVVCSSPAVVPLLSTEWTLLLRTLQHWQQRPHIAYQQPTKLPLPWGSRPHLTHGSLGPKESTPERHRDPFSRFAQHFRVINTQTDRSRYVRHLYHMPCLCTACMWCDLI